MSKMLPKKYKSEDAVKSALKIDSLNKLSKDKSKKLELMMTKHPRKHIMQPT